MWPKYYPDECPPKDAEPKDSKMFRLVANDPPTEDDFQPVKILQPNRIIDDHCMACGLSVSDSPRSLDSLRRRVKAFRNHKIAEGHIKNSDGVLLSTFRDPAHHTWWVEEDARPVFENFEVVMS